MTEQNPLLRLLGLEQRSGNDRRQQRPPAAAPPPPPASKKQSSEFATIIPSPSSADYLAGEGLNSVLKATSPLPQTDNAQSEATKNPPSQVLATSSLLKLESAGPKPQDDFLHRRQFDRKPMPFGGVAPVGEMTAPTGQKWHISLWDVSMGGLCVVADSAVSEALGSLFSISMYESFGLGSAFFNANLRWRTTEADNTYLGLEFENQDLLKNGCFLIDYVNTDL
jgi:hypothetical protein